MGQNTERNVEQMRTMDTEALERIVDAPHVKAERPTKRHPLAGLVHIMGIGNVPVQAIQDELTTRERN